jgi:hypothetical protein
MEKQMIDCFIAIIIKVGLDSRIELNQFSIIIFLEIKLAEIE